MLREIKYIGGMKLKTLWFFIGGIFVSCQQIPLNKDIEYFQPNALRVELLKGREVKNVKDNQPEFSWAIRGDHTYAQQNAYRIQLWDITTNMNSQPIWDSGKQNSAQSNAVSYQGNQLQVNHNYKWRVKVWLNTETNKMVESGWSQAQLFTTDKVFSNTASQHDLVSTAVAPQFIKKIPNGRYLMDFGKVAFGYLELGLNSDRDGTINVHLAERGNEQGALSEFGEKSSVRFYSVPVKVYEKFDVYAVHPPRDKRNTKSGKAIAIPGRFGRITPFRFVEIDTGEVNISNIQAKQIALHYPFNPYASSFNSSNDTLNAIWDLSKYSMKATSFAGIYLDGDRERIPYEADAYINQLSHYLVDDEYSLARYSHEYLIEHPTWPTEWKQHSVMMAWTDWMYTGDVESLKASFKTLKEQKLLSRFANQDGLLSTFPNGTHKTIKDIVDWPPVERDGYELKKINTVINAFHYLNLKQMAQIATAIGESQDADDFTQQANTLYKAFNRTLFDSKTGLYIDGVGSSHSAAHANILPLAVGLVPDDRKAKVIEFIKSKKMAVSVYFAQYLMEALYQNGEADYALSLLSSKQKRSWYNMIRVGSTISLEAWDDEFKPNQDWNHAWGSVPGNIVGRYILGVKPLTAGFEQMEIAPQFADLEFIEGKVPTIKGPVTLSAKQVLGKSVTLTITIPNNVNAILSLPFAKGKQVKLVTINNKQVKFNANTGLLDDDALLAGKYLVEVFYK
ncbi:family 78 glycoside hydrolase catalytic domain [Paraglaciecola aquimarina]|uniref:alpha-L-rhamnosidase n=1 Tax=Paraglaciecola algarum TaxID=3050085 RepID=A0ABS9D2V6_9ALTE|nr:alpha-L-rhamnosidase C-terminal domain-containing protein [Paraglaciecola sp. G1-23]MCF2946939.1 family 78 glycoside hydrolase catalytic domain [Paraglaciecola sp. G1-23]